MRKRIFSLTAILVLALAVFLSAGEARLLRTPDINGDLLVFVYAGDIWSVPAQGGTARRLTSHPGLELSPKISPDGKWIAFSGEYSGTRQVYVIPSEGGSPRQLTYYNSVGLMPPRGGYDNQVLDWTPDSKKILFRGNRTPFGERNGKYFLVGLDGGLETALQIPEAGGGTFSPDGRTIAYTPISREFRTWKRYKGGRAQDIWTYDLDKDTAKRLTDFEGTDQHPIWVKDKIVFVSDRDLTLNFYSYDLKTAKIEQITAFKDYDVLWPSGRNGRIAFEKGGEINILDTAAMKTHPVRVDLDFDNPNTLPYFKTVDKSILNFDISPTGKRAVFEARGDLFTVPATEGVTVNLTRSAGVREMNPAWSPDGRYVAYYSDKTGEYELYLMDVSAGNAVTALTENSRTWRFAPLWSPDSSKIAFGDKTGTLRFIDIKTKAVTDVDSATVNDFQDYTWAPDSKWIAYPKDTPNGQIAIFAYSLEKKTRLQLTEGLYNDGSPAFSQDGKYLYFSSNRNFNLTFSSFEFDYLYTNAGGVYAIALAKDAPPLLPEKNDVEPVKKDEPKPEAKADAKSKAEEPKKGIEVKIDADGILRRIIALPLPPGNYGGVLAADTNVFYFRDGGIFQFSLSDRKESPVLAGINGLAVSADRKKILYRHGQAFGIVDLRPGQKPGDGALRLVDMTMKIEPRLEWAQIFNDAIRIYRDWFYVRNMHGVDWAGMKEKYGRLVPYLGHRADLDFIFGELVGELNVGHAYVEWGDIPWASRVEGGLLGADLAADAKAGRYVIKKIYPGESWNEALRSPLTESGVDVKEGDYLIALNGRDVTLKDNPYQFLENTFGRRIAISVNAKPEPAGARESWIRPIKSEQGLFYLDWVQSRRALAEKLSGGRVGYIHVPDTSVPGNMELFKGFYSYSEKDALIIDERYNGGGFIPGRMVEILHRPLLSYWAGRNPGMTKVPNYVHSGPKAMLINHYSASGGDAFPYFFKELNIGPLIGTRTWGGLVGIGGNPVFVDGGSIDVPQSGIVGTNGEWVVEGVGVSPDIEVWDSPDQVVKGHDPSLEKAVEVLMKELAAKPAMKPVKPADPDRSKWREKK